MIFLHSNILMVKLCMLIVFIMIIASFFEMLFQNIPCPYISETHYKTKSDRKKNIKIMETAQKNFHFLYKKHTELSLYIL